MTTIFLSSCIRWSALFLLSVALNELFSIYVRPMHIALGWALTALWILFDGIVVATQLAQAEARLKEQADRVDALQAEILTQSRIILNTSDTRALMCEIRERVVAQGQRLHHHRVAVVPPALGEMRSRSESAIAPSPRLPS
jgi:hypothetical protein